MTEERSKLGRGLSALFEDDEPAAPPGGAGPASLPVADLAPGPFQPREIFDDEAMAALIDSVAERGVIQPLIVRADPGAPGRYQIVAGERRWRAAQAARLHEVPVVVQELSDDAALEVALIENIQRQDLTPIEEAEGYRRLTAEFDRTQEELARALGKSRSHIANAVRLLNLPARSSCCSTMAGCRPGTAARCSTRPTRWRSPARSSSAASPCATPSA